MKILGMFLPFRTTSDMMLSLTGNNKRQHVVLLDNHGTLSTMDYGSLYFRGIDTTGCKTWLNNQSNLSSVVVAV